MFNADKILMEKVEELFNEYIVKAEKRQLHFTYLLFLNQLSTNKM